MNRHIARQLAFLCVMFFAVDAAVGARPFVISLAPITTVHSKNVSLADLIEGAKGDEHAQRLFRDIDVGVIAAEESEVAIRQSFLKIRLMLAGWRASEFRMTGPETILVRYEPPPPVSDSDIEAVALKTVATTSEVSEKELRVQLNRPLMTTLSRIAQETPELRIEVLPPLRSGLGSVTMNVRLWRGGTLVASKPTRFDVSRRQRVAVMRVSKNRGDELRNSDIQFENRFLDRIADEPQEDDVIGLRLRTTMKAGEIISLRDLDKPVAKQKETVVASRDKVFVTAISGGVRIQLRHAEALQAGRVGDVISVRNIDSSKVIAARVTGPGAVEIRLR